MINSNNILIFKGTLTSISRVLHVIYSLDQGGAERKLTNICLKSYTNNEKLGLHQKKRHSPPPSPHHRYPHWQQKPLHPFLQARPYALRKRPTAADNKVTNAPDSTTPHYICHPYDRADR